MSLFLDPTKDEHEVWRQYLNKANDCDIAKTGLTRKELERVIQICSDEKILPL